MPELFKYTIKEKCTILDHLIWSDLFERFITSKYSNKKCFSLEGGKLLNPSFAGKEDNSKGGGDVKYHLGTNYMQPTPLGKKVALLLVAIPLHLEAKDLVVLGKTQVLQDFAGNNKHKMSMVLLMHGDAAFAGQGVVYKMMGMYNLPNYTTGSTIHIIVNNQIGFTTNLCFSCLTPYPLDIAKSINTPIFHINGNDVEVVAFVAQLATNWRTKFKKDVIIDPGSVPGVCSQMVIG
ncbi:2-oxoglutarate dehydrogenase E1 component [Thecaphora frezii]